MSLPPKKSDIRVAVNHVAVRKVTYSNKLTGLLNARKRAPLKKVVL